MATLLRWALPLAIAAGCIAVPGPSAAQMPCSEWTSWQPVGALTVLFSWRLCEAPGERWRIEWRFANHGRENLEFRYEIYTGMVASCGEGNRGRRFTRGRYRMLAGQQDQNSSGQRTIRRTGFETRYALWVCVIPDG